ncbi:MAG: hypothetical protein FWF22_10395, partial [Treponema sp.]|nr:hypothetical protein [Treponema sp.]
GNGTVDNWADDDTNHGEFMRNNFTVGLTTLGSSKITIDPPFRIRNSQFRILLDTRGGNGTKYYTISYVVPAGAAISASQMQRGRVYTIVYPGSTDWPMYGALNNSTNTTFVATGPAQGNGTVMQYTAAGPVKTGSSAEAAVTFDDLFSGADFDSIPDSPKIEGTGDIAPPHNERLFIIKVYDSTVAGQPESEQLAHAVLIAVDIDNKDSKVPVISIDPFRWNNRDDNSLYENSKENGHIELEANLPAAFYQTSGLMDKDPKVSGKISVKGTASDNNTIGEILFSFAGGAPVSAATFVPTRTPKWQPIDNFTAAGWKFSITKESHDLQGHNIEWQLDLDTGKMVSAVAAKDQVLTVTAKDRSSPTPNSSVPGTVQTTAAAKTSYYRMDVVPYISGISTIVRNSGGLRDQNIRSADGKYSIRLDANNIITIRGFNLNPTGTNGGVRILKTTDTYNPDTVPSAGTNVPASPAANSYTTFNMTNSASLTSGYLAVWTNGIGTLNNMNNNDSVGSFVKVTTGANAANGYNEENMPNREADRYITQNITLTDDRYLQFFKVLDTGVSNSGYPVMIMDKDDPVFGYINTSGAPAGSDNNYPDYAMPQRSKYDGTTGAIIGSIEYLIKGSAWDAMGMAKDDGGRYIHATTFNRSGSAFHLIYDKFASLYTNKNGWGAGINFAPTSGSVGLAVGTNAVNAISLESLNFAPGLVMERFVYPKIIAKGDSTTTAGAAYYMFYFDRGSRKLIFRNFRIRSGTFGTGSGITSTQMYQTSPYSQYINIPRNTGPTAGGTNLCNATFSTGRLEVSSAANASRFFDFGVTPDNRVVFAYFDESSGKLKLGYSNNVIDGNSPEAAQPFTMNTAINDLLPDNFGMYVSMVVDGNAVHIAAMDSSDGDLRYLYIPNYSGTDFTSVIV